MRTEGENGRRLRIGIPVMAGQFHHQTRRTGFETDSQKSLHDFVDNPFELLSGKGKHRLQSGMDRFFIHRHIGDRAGRRASLVVGGDMRIAGILQRPHNHAIQIALPDRAAVGGKKSELHRKGEIPRDPGLRLPRSDAGADDPGLNLLHIKRNRAAVRAEDHNGCIAELNHGGPFPSAQKSSFLFLRISRYLSNTPALETNPMYFPLSVTGSSQVCRLSNRRVAAPSVSFTESTGGASDITS